MFNWHFIYLEVALRSHDQQIVCGITESDLIALVTKLRQQLRVQSKELDTELLRKGMPLEEILDFIMDSFLMDPNTFEVSLSMIQL